MSVYAYKHNFIFFQNVLHQAGVTVMNLGIANVHVVISVFNNVFLPVTLSLPHTVYFVFCLGVWRQDGKDRLQIERISI